MPIAETYGKKNPRTPTGCPRPSLTGSGCRPRLGDYVLTDASHKQFFHNRISLFSVRLAIRHPITAPLASHRPYLFARTQRFEIFEIVLRLTATRFHSLFEELPCRSEISLKRFQNAHIVLGFRETSHFLEIGLSRL